MFAGNAGLASDAQACLEFGTWDYVGFEKDPSVWAQACDLIRNHMIGLDRREKELRNRIKRNMKLVPIFNKVKASGVDSLNDEEV